MFLIRLLSSLGGWITDHATVISAVISAIAAGIIAWFTIRLTHATSGQLATLEKSVELARAEFVAAHRPRLRIRSIKPMLTDGVGVGVHFIVTNWGETPGHIKRIETTLWLRTSSGDEFLPETTDAEIGTLVGGENALSVVRATDLRYNRLMGVHDGTGGQFEFRGFIEYSDDNGVDRLTGFWRIYDAKTSRFRPKDDADYEYEY